jgi:hypothetical protein
MEALRTTTSGTDVESPTSAADDLDYQLLCGMESAVSDILKSNLADGEVYAGSSFELLEFLRDRGYRESQLVLAILCARALGFSLPVQVEKGQGAYVALLKSASGCGRPTEGAHTESLKKRLRTSRRGRVIPDDVRRQRAAIVAAFVFPVKKSELLAAARGCRACAPASSPSSAQSVAATPVQLREQYELRLD